MFARLFCPNPPKKLTLCFVNAYKDFSSEAITMAVDTAITTIGEIHSFIKSNSYISYPSEPPHTLVISGQRISLNSFMDQEPSSNFYSYLKKNGFKHDAKNPNDVPIAIVKATYEDIQEFTAQAALKKDKLRLIPDYEVHSGRVDRTVPLGMYMIQTARNPALMGLVLSRALAEKQETYGASRRP